MLQEQPRLWTVLLQRSPSHRAREVALISAAPCCISFTPIFPSEVEKPRELHLQAEKCKSELPSKPYPSELGSAPRWSSTCTHSGLRGTVQEGDVPWNSGCSQRSALPRMPTPCPAACKKPHFSSRSAPSVPFSRLNFRRHQRAAESWWEPSPCLGREEGGEKAQQIKPKPLNRRHTITSKAHCNYRRITGPAALIYSQEVPSLLPALPCTLPAAYLTITYMTEQLPTSPTMHTME